MGVFDVVGPVMIGPSSSHTAGAARIGLMAREILKDEPKRRSSLSMVLLPRPIRVTVRTGPSSPACSAFLPTMSACARPLPLPQTRAWLLNSTGPMKKWTIPTRYASP